MKGADGHFRRGLFRHHAGDAFSHFAGRLVGESDGKDLGGGNFSLEHVDNATGDRAGFTRACSGEDEHRSVEGADRLALRMIEGFEGKR